MGCVGRKNKVKPGICLIKIKCQFVSIYRILLTGNRILITVISGGKDAIKFIIETMSPLNISILVAVFIDSVAIQLKPIVADITCQVYIVLCIYFVADTKIGIIKRSTAVFVVVIRYCLK